MSSSVNHCKDGRACVLLEDEKKALILNTLILSVYHGCFTQLTKGRCKNDFGFLVITVIGPKS